MKGTKSKKSRRRVRLSDVAIQVLKNQKFEQEKMQLENKDIYNNYDNLIFTDEFGDYIKGERLLDNFHTLLDKAGVERHNIHDLRHTFCSFLINNKRTVKDVQTLLGHSSAQITLDLYTEQFEESEIEALEGVTDCIPVEIQAKDVQLQ